MSPIQVIGESREWLSADESAHRLMRPLHVNATDYQ